MKATEIASEMSVIIPGLRFCSSGRAICRKGSPPYRNMRTEKNGSIQPLPGKAGIEKPSRRWSIWLKSSTGTDSSSDTKKRVRNICSCPV